MDNSIDLQFVEYIVKSLVGKPEAVTIKRTIDEKGVLLELTVDPEDLGRVIGKRGATAQSLRTLLRALGTKNDARYNLKIVDNGEPRPAREDREDRHESRSDADADAGVAASAPADDAWSMSSSSSSAAADEDDTASHNDAISKARKDLADLDDLDI